MFSEDLRRLATIVCANVGGGRKWVSNLAHWAIMMAVFAGGVGSLGLAAAWSASVFLLIEVAALAGRQALRPNGRQGSLFAFAGLYTLASTAFASAAIPLWMHPEAQGGAIATLLLAYGALRAVLSTRGNRTLLLCLLPNASLLFLAPIIAHRFAGADLPSLSYWACSLLVLSGIWIWAKDTARLDGVSEAALRQAEARRLEAESATAARSAFVAMVSHELRTPISGVLAAASELETSQADPHVKANAAVIVDAGRMMRTLLNDLLDHAKIQAGRMQIEAVPFQFDALMEQTAEFFEIEAAKKGLEFVRAWRGLPATVTGDPTRIRQILNNLLSNALKFTATGSIRLEVAASEAGSDTIVSIKVTDTGVGISPEGLAGLFRPYQQADASVARNYGGTGLGLSISLDLARLMGGDLTVASELGVGSTFEATLRLGRSERATDPATAAPAAAPDFEGLKVLVADDHEINRRVFRLLLEPLGICLTIVNDGTEAVEALDREPFDLALMDVNMPGLSGPDVTRRLRAQPGPNRAAPVIAVTGSGSEDDIARCKAAGMDLHVVKPIEVAQLLEAMAIALDGTFTEHRRTA